MELCKCLLLTVIALVLCIGLSGCQQETMSSPRELLSSDQNEQSHPQLTTDESVPTDENNLSCGPPPWESSLVISDHFLEWTPDGSQVMFNQTPVGEAPTEAYNRTAIWVVAADGTQLHMLVDANPGEGFVYGFHADVSPDGTRIVYSTCLYPLDLESTVLKRKDAVLSPPLWAPERYEIAVIGIGGGEPQRLTRNRNLDHYPAWSTDGSRIVFIVDMVSPLSSKKLFIMAANGSDAREVSLPVNATVVLAPPVWSPDRQHLAFLATEKDSHTYRAYLNTVRTDGTNLVQIAKTKEPSVRWWEDPMPARFSWSPDGNYLVFVMAGEEGTSGAVYTVRPDGTELQLVMEPQAPGWSVSHALWSPDGSELLVVSDQGLFLVQLNSSSLRKLDLDIVPANTTGLVAAWSPDSARIAIHYPDIPQLYTVARDGTDRRDLITLDADGNLAPANSPRQDE